MGDDLTLDERIQARLERRIRELESVLTAVSSAALTPTGYLIPPDVLLRVRAVLIPNGASISNSH